jgi:phosphoribosyl 1,2-cyclic phosphodiesterase
VIFFSFNKSGLSVGLGDCLGANVTERAVHPRFIDLMEEQSLLDVGFSAVWHREYYRRSVMMVTATFAAAGKLQQSACLMRVDRWRVMSSPSDFLLSGEQTVHAILDVLDQPKNACWPSRAD